MRSRRAVCTRQGHPGEGGGSRWAAGGGHVAYLEQRRRGTEPIRAGAVVTLVT
ncbi:hypothetical protein [Actinoplanes awajinensis]|uniref:hypothetical protein n=1 Tax=Actinoplanes awajinensis TaxID=135946 RepID=UPI0012F7FC03|nr:hypothetical protein [Actinoplanes awajinensis]